MPLYNAVDRKILLDNLMFEKFVGKTISFYRYFILDDPNVTTRKMPLKLKNWYSEK